MTTFAYCRVSGSSQDLAGQIEALKNAGATVVFAEKISGKSADDRKEFQKLLKVVQPSDVILCTKLDRFARSTRDLLNIIHDLQQRGVGLRCIHDPWLDTTASNPMAEFLLTIMSGCIQLERHIIKQRCDEGRRRYIENGGRLGRKPRLSDYQKQELLQRLAGGETQSSLSKSYQISQSRISEIAAEQ